MNLKKIGLSLLLIGTPLIVGGGVYVSHSMPQQEETYQPDEQWQDLQKRIEYQMRHFPGTAGIVVKDLRRGWTIEYNSSHPFPSASLVKLPIMAILYQAQVRGQVSLDESLPLLRKWKTAGSGKLKFARAGTRFPIRQLIYKMITESDNTATNMLTNLFGLEYYNSQMMALGLTRTNFSRTIMDLRRRDQGVENYTTPQDMAKLLEMIYNQELTGSEEMLEVLKEQKVRDRLPAGIPRTWEVGHKTGLMRRTCHDVGIVFSPNGDYVICALTTNVRSYRRAKHFIGEIAHLTSLYYSDPSLRPKEEKKWFWTFLRNRKTSSAHVG